MEEAAKAAPGANEEVSRLPLRALGLKPGMAMQTRRIVEGAKKKESQYFGAIEGKGVMVGPLGSEGAKTELEEGEVCVVRGFTGQYEYSFLTKVLQTFEKPFAYALLSYPAQVDARLVRQSMRIQCAWPSTVSVPAADGSLLAQGVTLIDLSTSGAMIKAASALAAIGTPIQITLSVVVDKAPLDLCLAASICHNNRASYEDAYFVGLAFKSLTPHDKLVLSYLTQSPQP
jgi:c-di-GMP-binding flagellar brake protein YcgR